MRRRHGGRLAALVLVALVLGLAGPALGQMAVPSASQDAATLSADLAGIEADLSQLRAVVEPGLEQRLQEIIQRSDALSGDAQLRLGRLQQQLAALGAAPGPSDPPEPPQIAAERASKVRVLAELADESRVASYLHVRANQLLETVAVRQRAAVLDVVLMATPPPWTEGIWVEAARDLVNTLAWLRFNAVAWADWFGLQGGLQAVLQAIAAMAAGVGLAVLTVRWLDRRLTAAEKEGDARASTALAALRPAIVPCAALLSLLALWSFQGWLAGSFGAVLQRALVATTLTVLGITMLRAPATTGLGLLRPEHAPLVVPRCAALVLLGLVVAIVKETALRQPAPLPSLLGAMAAICGGAALVLLGPLLLGSTWRQDPRALAGRRFIAQATVSLIAFGPLAAALLGRGVLATYVYNRALGFVVLLWAVVQVRRVLRAVLRNALDRPAAAPAADPVAEDGSTDAPARIASFWAAMLVDIGLALFTLHALLHLLDIPQAQIDYWTALVWGDIQVGNAVISLPNIFLAIMVLAGGLFGSSRLRLWLGKQALSQSGLEIGLRTSLAAGAGYLGMALAFLAAIATAGISLSSVAIVAGALSVGMGFGLRTVVENFVAGLLMLIERPIRVGDWVVIGDTEGTVRRISVRATEIETFDLASVVVPNSLFVSSPVTNWTLQNRRGRIRIKLGVAYDSKPKEVEDVLLACARANREIAAYPAPQALFTDFGDSALLFELRCFVRDVDHFPGARSELLAAIAEALSERGIEIPFPQQVIHRGPGWEEVEAVTLPPPIAIRPAS